MGILRAVLIILACPVVGGAAGLSVSLIGHWLSGEARDPSSGQPWLMMAMLFFPLGLLVGTVSGLGMAAVSWKGVNPPLTGTEAVWIGVAGTIALIGIPAVLWIIGVGR